MQYFHALKFYTTNITHSTVVRSMKVFFSNCLSETYIRLAPIFSLWQVFFSATSYHHLQHSVKSHACFNTLTYNQKMGMPKEIHLSSHHFIGSFRKFSVWFLMTASRHSCLFLYACRVRPVLNSQSVERE